MKNIVVLIVLTLILPTGLLAKKYQSAEKLSRDIPTVSIPKIVEKSAIALKLGTSINDTYASTFPVSLVYSYKFSSFLGFIVDASYLFYTDSSLKDSIDDAFENATSKIVLPEYAYNKAYLNMGLIFKPIYGKISFLSEKIIHYDLYLSLLAGATYNVVRKRVEISGKLEDENKILPSVLFSLGQNYYLTNSLAFNIEVLDNITFGEMFDGGESSFINQNFSIRVGVNYIF